MRLLLALSVLLAGCVSIVEHRRPEDVAAFIEKGSPRLLSDALCIASANGWLDLMGDALKRGAAVDKPGSEGVTPLLYAVRKGQTDAASLLLERGADPAQLRVASPYLGGHDALAYSRKAGPPTLASLLDGTRAPKTAAVAAYASGAHNPLPGAKAAAPVLEMPAAPAAERPRDYALVVGVEDYEKLPDAPYAGRDAAAVARRLEALGLPSYNVILLKDKKGEAANLRAYLREWLPLNVKLGSTVLFFFAGRVAADAKGAPALLAWDAAGADEGVRLDEVFSALARTRASRAVVLLDAAFPGGAPAPPAGTRVTVLAAAVGAEKRAELADLGHGLFTYHLLQELSADPRATGLSMLARLRRQGGQTPVLAGGALDVPLLPPTTN